jgi:hypothetical protein
VVTGRGQAPLRLGGVGQARVTEYGTVAYLNLEQPMADEGGKSYRLQLDLYHEGGVYEVEACLLIDADQTTVMLENSLSYYDRWRHTAVFQGGSLTADFFAAWGGTPSSGLLVRASGVLDGVPFEQRNYWDLVSNNDHHFFGADWAVLFSAPIGSFCGLRIDDGNPIGAMSMYPDLKIHTVDCDLSPREERPLQHQDAVQFELERGLCPGIP